jgi:hypothetical protein
LIKILLRMLQIQYALKTASRVIAGIERDLDPSLAEVEELRLFAPEHAEEPIYDLACRVIAKAIRNRRDGV